MSKHNSKDINFLLGDLSNYKNYQNPIFIKDFESSLLINLLHTMLRIRIIEDKLALEKKSGIIKGPVHLSSGQEAIAVGISHNLNNSDFIFGAHRSHGHLLALGSDIKKFFAEILGKEEGHSKGMGGSMHLIDKSVGFHGSVPIVSGTISLAVGAAISIKIKGGESVSLVYFGDGACEEGVIHESLNLASLMELPVIFVVENNLFSSHMDIFSRQTKDSTSRFALAHDIPYKVVDGNDVLSVIRASSDLVNNARVKKKPGFIEAITYRQYGHVDWRRDIDVGVNRKKEVLEGWLKRDPILRLKNALLNSSLISEKEYQDLYENEKKNIDRIWSDACKSKFPSKNQVLSMVYKND